MKKEQIACETQDGLINWVNTDSVELRTSAYGILFDSSGNLLLIQAHLPLWEFPGGAPENGETLFEAVKREFKEETGIIVEPKELVLLRESFYQTPGNSVYHSLQHFFIVEKMGGEVTHSEGNLTQATWKNLTTLSGSNMNKGAFDALQAYLAYPQKGFKFLSAPKK